MKKCGHNEKLNYETKDAQPDDQQQQKKKRRRKTIWFNPPFCMSVKTNIGRKFLNLVKKHFTAKNPLTRIFNKHNMRVSYCCMKNMGAIIKAHNRAILKAEDVRTPDCNCDGTCILKDQRFSCRTTGVIYRATVTTRNARKFYIGLTATAFKTRYANHKSSFKLARKRSATALSTYIWELKDDNEDFEISWEILKRVRPKRSGERKCQLCLAEATEILFAGDNC